MEVGTLKELGVDVGDVLQWDGGVEYHCTVTDVTSHNVCMKTPECPVEYSFAHCTHQWRVIHRANPKPKLWRDMTPEEKGALLLAAHEGSKVEYYASVDHEWLDCGELGARWYGGSAYRIKPQPKVETVELYGRQDVQWVLERCKYDTHRITFQTIDGKPDCASIKMGAL